jgi:hypothetical protein
VKRFAYVEREENVREMLTKYDQAIFNFLGCFVSPILSANSIKYPGLFVVIEHVENGAE